MPESLVTYLTADIIKSFIIFQALIILLMISNICILHRTGKHPRVKVFPRVSILIPARNEEKNIDELVLFNAKTQEKTKTKKIEGRVDRPSFSYS